MTRGLVLSLSNEQIVKRALYLAQEATIDTLDDFVDKDPERLSAIPGYQGVVAAGTAKCPDIYYLLKDHNGGRDPRTCDPADRWTKDGGSFVNRTCDCIGGACWCAGFDRYQPVRFAHIYSGWINTDSMLMDARGPAKCFRESPTPFPGCFMVCASGSRGHAVGHISVVVSVPAEFDRKEAECWHAIQAVDVAAYNGIANRRTTGRGWFDTNAGFVYSVMSA